MGFFLMVVADAVSVFVEADAVFVAEDDAVLGLAPGLGLELGPGLGPGMGPGMGPGLGPGLVPGLGPNPGVGPGVGPGPDPLSPVPNPGLGPPKLGAELNPGPVPPNELNPGLGPPKLNAELNPGLGFVPDPLEGFVEFGVSFVGVGASVLEVGGLGAVLNLGMGAIAGPVPTPLRSNEEV